MEFSWDGILSRAKPAACAASPVDFVAREITRRNSCPGVWIGGVAQRDRAVAITRPAFNATGEPPLTLSLFMITCQGTTQAR